MKVEFTNRALADLRKLSADSRATFGDAVAIALAEHLESAPRVIERPGIRVFPLIRYPYKIFYRVLEDRIRILHIRHTSRRPWIGGR